MGMRGVPGAARAGKLAIRPERPSAVDLLEEHERPHRRARREHSGGRSSPSRTRRAPSHRAGKGSRLGLVDQAREALRAGKLARATEAFAEHTRAFAAGPAAGPTKG
jgi:hypothetical protein